MKLLLSLVFLSLSSFAKDSCLRQCTLNVDCGIGGVCHNQVCQYQSLYCASIRWSTNDRGESVDCGGYICNESTGQCLRDAISSGHCTPGYVFDGQKSCIPSVNCDSNNPSCAQLKKKWKVMRERWENLFPQPKPPMLSCVACENHGSCSNSEMCWDKRCVRDGLHCAQIDSTTHGSYYRGTLVRSCNEYICSINTGECLNSCTSNSDCTTGFVCTKDRLCVKPIL